MMPNQQQYLQLIPHNVFKTLPGIADLLTPKIINRIFYSLKNLREWELAGISNVNQIEAANRLSDRMKNKQ